MNNPDIATYFVDPHPSVLRPYGWGEPDTRSPEELDPEHVQRQLDLVRTCWLDVVAGRPILDALPSWLTTALGDMQAAATWVSRHPEHPALLAIQAQLHAPPLFLILGRNVAWQDPERADLYVSALTGGLHVEDSSGLIPDDAYDDNLHMSGLLGVSPRSDMPSGLPGLKVVLWPLPHTEVDRMIAEAR